MRAPSGSSQSEDGTEDDPTRPTMASGTISHKAIVVVFSHTISSSVSSRCRSPRRCLNPRRLSSPGSSQAARKELQTQGGTCCSRRAWREGARDHRARRVLQMSTVRGHDGWCTQSRGSGAWSRQMPGRLSTTTQFLRARAVHAFFFFDPLSAHLYGNSLLFIQVFSLKLALSPLTFRYA